MTGSAARAAAGPPSVARRARAAAKALLRVLSCLSAGVVPDGVSMGFGARSARHSLAPYATSRSFCASARDWSFLSDWFSIWRMRSRVTLNVRPTSSSVRGCSPPRP